MKYYHSNVTRLVGDIDNIIKQIMPHTAKYVVKHYIEEGRKNDKLYGGIAISERVKFTELNEF